MDAIDDKLKSILKKVGKVRVPSTYLFLGANDTLSSEIVKRVANLLKAKKEDIIFISPFDSEGKKDILSIKQARELTHTFSLTPAGLVRIGVIMGSDNISVAAANALLKLLEEPPKYGLIMLFSKTDNIIDTIKSRATTINCFHDQDDDDVALVQFMIGKDFHEQSSALENIVKKNQINLFLDQLQSIYLKKMRASQDKKVVLALKDVESARHKVKRNANPRLTLECLVLKHQKMLNHEA